MRAKKNSSRRFPVVSAAHRATRNAARAVVDTLEQRCMLSLTITPTFDSSINNDVNAATIKSTINTAIQNYANAFSNNVTAAITFKEVTTGLGSSSTAQTAVSYSAYRAALVSHSSSSDDATALAHLASGTNNPTNGSSSIALALPLARALGFNAATPNDGTVSINTSICNLTRTNINNSKFDLLAVAEHEIDEVLGIGSVLSGLSNGAPSPTGAVAPEDLFRYDSAGVRSFTTSSTATAFFSLDGTTDLAQFNQDATGDFNDWFSKGAHTARVQDAFATAGATPDLGVELVALDAIGWTRAATTHQAPVASNDTVSTNENTAVLINELSNDTASGGAAIDPTTVKIGTAAAHGTTSIDPVTGKITYTPASNYFGPDSFTYTVKDSTGATSNGATVSITVNQVVVHQAPVASNDTVSTNENTAVLINELSNDTASGGATIDASSVKIGTAPTHGSTSIDPTTGKITYTPANNYTGPDSFAYTVKDSTGATSNVATVSITVNPVVVHLAPVAADDAATTAQNTAVLINELSNDTASGGATIDPTTVKIGTAAGHGSTSIDPATGKIAYTPAANYTGPDSFTYTVKDSTGATSNVATVSITVTSGVTHQAPVAADDTATTNENTAVLIDELSNDSASGGATIDATSVKIGTAAAHGTTSIDLVTGKITYTPASNYNGPDSFTYTVKDSTGATSNIATVAITVKPVVVNGGPPVAHDDTAKTTENAPVSIDELANDAVGAGASLDPASVKIAAAAAHGTTSIDPTTGKITYTPAAGYVGPDSFTYTVSDNLGATSNAATVSIAVGEGNGPSPTPGEREHHLIAHDRGIRARAGVAITTPVVAVFFDLDHDPIGNFMATVDYGDGTIVTGVVHASGGRFFVTGPSHTYADAGRYKLVVTLTDTDGTSATTKSKAIIRSAPHEKHPMIKTEHRA